MLFRTKTNFVASHFLILLLLLLMDNKVDAAGWRGGQITVVLRNANKFERDNGVPNNSGKYVSVRFQSGQYTFPVVKELSSGEHYGDTLKFFFDVPAVDELTAHSKPSGTGAPLHQIWTVLMDCAAITTCENPDRPLDCANVKHIYAQQRKVAFPTECIGALKLQVGIVDRENKFTVKHVMDVSQTVDKTPHTNWLTFFTENDRHNIEIDIRDLSKF